MLIAALALCFLAVWIVLPPFHAGLLPLAVGTPELSPWLLLVSLSVCAVTVNASGGSSSTRRTAFNLAAAAAVVYASPLVRTPLVLRSFDRAMEQGLGADYLNLISASSSAALRTHALSALDFARGIARVDFLVRRGVEFARPAGVPLTVDIYRPTTAGPHPVLLQIYGGAWRGGTPEDNASFASWFASKGYLVVAIDYRHAPESRWPAQIQDVRSAVEWVMTHANEYEADTSRMAFIGRSAGAQLALVAAYQSGAPPARGVVSYYGPTDLVEGWRDPPRPDPLDVRRILENYLGGTPDTAQVAYHDASPVSYVTSQVPPTLILIGGRDHVVSPRFGRELHERLRDAGGTSVLLEIPWAEHAFDALPNGLSGQIALYYTERFLAWALR